MVAQGAVTIMVGPGHREWPFKEMSPHSFFFVNDSSPGSDQTLLFPLVNLSPSSWTH